MAVRFPILYLVEPEAEAAVLSSGVLAYLVRVMPQARFTIVASPQSAPLFMNVPRLDRLLILEKEGHLEWLGLWNQIRDTKWGLIVDMRGSTISTRLRRDKRAVRGKPEAGLHAVEQAARVLHLDEAPAPELFVSDKDREVAAALVKPNDKPILAIGPGADWIGKAWPAERYSKIATALTATDGPLAAGRLLIVGSEADREIAHTIRLSVPRNRVIEAFGRLTPLQTVAALSHASLYVGADSLWTQLAVASGIPCIGVYGPSDDRLVGPWGGVSVRGPRSLAEYRELDPRLNQAIQHMTDVPAERVLKSARKLLAERAARS